MLTACSRAKYFMTLFDLFCLTFCLSGFGDIGTVQQNGQIYKMHLLKATCTNLQRQMIAVTHH